MTPTLHAIYQRLPPSAQFVAASMRGFQLRQWRYGDDTDRLVGEALEREHWSVERWQNWRQDRLAQILDRARRTVPFYRTYWQQIGADDRSPERLEDWPVIDKTALRRQPRSFLSDECNPRQMFHEHTSGTSGTPLDLWWSRDTVRRWYALFEARWRLWHGVSRHDRWAILGGQTVVPQSRRTPPFWVWNAPMRQLYLSSYHLAPDLIASYLTALRKYRIEYLWGYPSALLELARTALAIGQRVPMRVVIANAEPLDSNQRQVIGEAFSCPVRDTYSMAEIVLAAGECAKGSLHLWPEVGTFELSEGVNETNGTSGELVCTGLFNGDMPLIRYAVGDRATIPAAAEPCECGRTLPLLAAVEGRSDDLLFTPDGRTVGRLDPVFKAGVRIREAQLIQETRQRVRIRYVPEPGAGDEIIPALTRALAARLGPMDFVFESVSRVPRTSSGKFRAVICDLPDAERTALQRSSNLERPA